MSASGLIETRENKYLWEKKAQVTFISPPAPPRRDLSVALLEYTYATLPLKQTPPVVEKSNEITLTVWSSLGYSLGLILNQQRLLECLSSVSSVCTVYSNYFG